MNSRRDFIKQSLALTAGFAIGFSNDASALLGRGQLTKYELTPFIIIGNDGMITLINNSPDMGQGSMMGVPT